MYLRQVVIEIHISGTKVATQQRSMRSENSCNGKLPLSAKHQAQASQPLMEMGHNVWRVLRLSRVLQYQENTTLIASKWELTCR